MDGEGWQTLSARGVCHKKMKRKMYKITTSPSMMYGLQRVPVIERGETELVGPCIEEGWEVCGEEKSGDGSTKREEK